MSEVRKRPWPEDTPFNRDARYCQNCWWRTKRAGELLCSRCSPAYERSLGREVEQPPAAQDKERAALSHLGAPVPVADDGWHDPFDCPDPTGDHCESARRRALWKAGLRIPGMRPVGTREDRLAERDF